jgi:ATP-binding cassette, subfamily C, bacterial LapB
VSDIFEQIEAEEEEGLHPIRLVHRKIAEAFARGTSRPIEEAETGILSCLVPIAESVGWRGTSRQIAEAMPHELPVTNIAELRSVLLRIGVQTERIEIPAYHVRDEYCPCIAVNGDDEVVVVHSIDVLGKAKIFDSVTASWDKVDCEELEGEVFLIRLQDVLAQQEELQRDGFVWPLIRRFGNSLKMVFWQSLAINLLGLVISFYVMYVYDKAIGTKSTDTLAVFFVGGLAAVGLELRLRHKRGSTIARMGARFDALAVSGAFQTVLGLPLPMSENVPLGAQLTRFRQFEVGRELFGGSLATSLIDLPFTLIFFLMIFALGGVLGFIPVAFALVLGITGLCTNPALSKQMRDMGEWKAKSDALLVEICTRLNLIRADNAEEVWLNRATETYRKYLTSKFRTQQFNNNLQVIAGAGVSVSGAAVLGFGSYEVMHGTLSLGALIAIMAVVWRVLGPVQSVFLSLHRIRSMVGTIRQIDRLVKIKREREPGRISDIGSKITGQLSLSGVFYRYSNRPELAIKGISLDIKQGEFVVLAGSSGAGKSTLLKIMLGLYLPQSGSVRVGDLDLRQIDTAEVRHTLSFLGQEPSFFYGTVAQNMRLVVPEATDDELEYALSMVGIRTGDPSLPEGMETRINAKNRRTMSLSFIQRLAISRAFLRNAPIILLDEPANHLDKEGDEALLRLIAKSRGQSTIIMSSARPSHMRLADRVIVLNEGAVIAQGKPEDIVPVILAQNARAAS